MDFNTFKTRYRDLLVLAAHPPEFTTELERLRTLATTLTPDSDRLHAIRLLTRLDRSIAAEQPTPPTGQP